MDASRPAFVKRGPCSRASRVRNQLRAYPGMKLYPRQSTKQVLRSILQVMQDSALSIETRLKEFSALLSGMPPWTQWPAGADSVVESGFQELQLDSPPDDLKDPEIHEEKHLDAHDEKGSDTRDRTDVLLGHELIVYNGGNPFLAADALDTLIKDAPGFSFTFLQWLRAVQGPDNAEDRVTDDQGQWLTVPQLRDRMRAGHELHIPTRTVGEPFQFPTRRGTHSVLKEEAL